MKCRQNGEAFRHLLLRYGELYRNLRDGIALVDMGGRIVDCNPAFQDLIGYSAEELLSLTYEDITPEKWHWEEKTILKEQVLKRGYSNLYEKEYRHKNGTIIPVEIRTYLMKDEKGDPVGFWAITRDISERKLMEKALHEEHTQLLSILDGSPVSTFVIDAKGIVVLWNRANELFTGIRREDVLGRPIDLSPLFREKKMPSLAELVLKMTDEEIISRFAKKGLRKSNLHPEAFEATNSIWIQGIEHTMAIQAIRLRDSDGNILGAIQCAQDITEQKRMEDERREREKLQSILQMAGTICHEMNQPLQVISGVSEFLMMNMSPGEPMYEKLSIILRHIQKINEITKKLMSLRHYQTQDYLGFTRIIDIQEG